MPSELYYCMKAIDSSFIQIYSFNLGFRWLQHEVFVFFKSLLMISSWLLEFDSVWADFEKQSIRCLSSVFKIRYCFILWFHTRSNTHVSIFSFNYTPRLSLNFEFFFSLIVSLKIFVRFILIIPFKALYEDFSSVTLVIAFRKQRYINKSIKKNKYKYACY